MSLHSIMDELFTPDGTLAEVPGGGTSLGGGNQQPSALNFRWGTIQDRDPTTVLLDGDTIPVPVGPNSLVGDVEPGVRVWCQLFGRRVIILGRGRGFLCNDVGAATRLQDVTAAGWYYMATATFMAMTDRPVAAVSGGYFMLNSPWPQTSWVTHTRTQMLWLNRVGTGGSLNFWRTTSDTATANYWMVNTATRETAFAT